MKILTVLLLLLPALAVHSQSAETIDSLLERDSISLADAAYILLGSADMIEPDGDSEEAFLQLQQVIPRYQGADPSAPASMADISLIGNQLFEVPPGLLMRITGSPRYAFRDARYRRIMQSSANPNDPVSGEAALRIANRYAEYVERGRPARM
ncbi:hypothetical protein [Spirochaeta africana]|uniref:Uncharacterized protein n=1 Tax=Spirochaeta africana (strain ATCC 700263 / DSM 8902 / Z-7692) TaxID=889378 RepID=H9UFM6_SPIAZ|nr:hypothetical protein [Spirochaeta africana]AFG36319.1 hypothetical protein Spiaf_0210 [Spirochaeta africana DSM 8902]